MKHLVEFPLQDGGGIVIEVDEPESQGTIRAGREGVIAQAKETFEEALDHVLPVAKSLAEKLHNTVNRPDEIEISFGVKLNTQVGAIIAAVNGEANFSVKMHWAEKEEEAPPSLS
jgi:hypothetical protein